MTTTSKLPSNSLLIFAGSADIDAGNMEQLLEMHLPVELAVPVIQRDIPGSYKGLQKVLAWLDEQFRGDLERPASLMGYIGEELQSAENTYLIVLWGDGGDKETEYLIDAASNLGVTVLDLTDGLDDLQFINDESKAPKQAGIRRGSRTRQREIAAAAMAADDDRAPWEDTSTETLAVPDLADLLATGFEAAARAIRNYKPQKLASVVGLPTAEKTAQPSDSAAPPLPQRRSARSARRSPAPAGKRAWLKNPDLPDDDPEAYHLKGRGRPRSKMQNWPVVELTEAEEKEIGLPLPEQG